MSGNMAKEKTTPIPKACQETVDRLTDLDEGALRMGDALRVQLHLLGCPQCRELRDELRRLPEVACQAGLSETASLTDVAQAALKGALARLPEVKAQARLRQPIESSVPLEIQAMLSMGADLTLQIMEMVHCAFTKGTVPMDAPFLPESVLAKLPPQDTWAWKAFDGGRVATLLGSGEGPRLSLLVAPRGFRRPEHVHVGTEQMLVLEGLLEDGDNAYPTGKWAHFGSGSIHAPQVLNEECWCLIREEGHSKFTGPFGWLKSMRGM